MQSARIETALGSFTRGHGTADLDGRKSELARLLTEGGVPEKDEILRVKHLVRDLMPKDQGGDERIKSFFSAYLDIYLGRIAGERSLERDGLRRCLAHLEMAQDPSPPR